jgi:hypothetical protein
MTFWAWPVNAVASFVRQDAGMVAPATLDGVRVV